MYNIYPITIYLSIYRSIHIYTHTHAYTNIQVTSKLPYSSIFSSDSPLTWRNQYTLDVLYWQRYSPDIVRFFSSSMHFVTWLVARMSQWSISAWWGSQHVKTSLLWFLGDSSVQLMLRLLPLKATNTVFSRLMPVKEHNVEVNIRAGIAENIWYLRNHIF